MRVLLLGKGAREHAIAWCLDRSELVSEIIASPGNPGIAEVARLEKLDLSDPSKVLSFAVDNKVDLVVIGPEDLLISGIPEAMRAAGIKVFGPGKAGALLESSKSFGKAFMDRYGIPTAPFDLCSNMIEAERAISARKAPYIIKADGLAAGKGCFVLDTRQEAIEISRSLLEDKILGKAGEKIIIEDYIEGHELTVLAITDGKTIHPLSPSQDHKRVFDNDKGPNTGGMGAYSPLPWIDHNLHEKINKDVLEPTLKGIQTEGIDYRGVIYAGLMMDKDNNPFVIEYNARFGDPEAQVVLPILNNDLAEIMLACSEKDLSRIRWCKSDKWAAGVVLASGGYPGTYETALPIEGLNTLSDSDDILIFHAGTAFGKGKEVVTAGGRVLTVVGISSINLAESVSTAYQAVEKISFQGIHYRKDIAAKAALITFNTGRLKNE